MNDDFSKAAAEQARILREKVAEAIEESDKLRGTLMEQARRSADATNEQTKAALESMEAAMKSGVEMLLKFTRGD